MIRYLIALALAFIATPLAAQTVTSETKLADQSPKTPGLIVGKAVTMPPSKKGTVLFDCGSKTTPFVGRVGSVANCPKAQAVLAAPSTGPAAPIVTTAPKDYGLSGHIAYGSKSDVRALQAMGAFPLRNGGVTITNVIADKVRTFVTPEKGRSTTLNDVTIDRVDVKTGKRGIYVRADSARWIIRNFRIAYIGPTSAPGDIPVGIQLNGTAHDILIENGDIGGFVNTEPAKYPNADNISCERGNYNITVRNVALHDATDGGFDCKATKVLLDNVRSSRNGRNFRFWGTGRATTLYSDSPRKAHIWVSGSGGDYVIDKLVATGGGVLVDAEAEAKLAIKACDLSGWTGTLKVNGKGAVTLGVGC